MPCKINSTWHCLFYDKKIRLRKRRKYCHYDENGKDTHKNGRQPPHFKQILLAVSPGLHHGWDGAGGHRRHEGGITCGTENEQ